MPHKYRKKPEYTHHKPSGYPRQNQQKKCGSPKVRRPIREEITKLKSLVRKGLYQSVTI